MGIPKMVNFSVPLMYINEDTGQIWFKRPGISPQWLLATKDSIMEFSTLINIDGPSIIGIVAAADDLILTKHEKQKPSQSSSDAMGAGTAAGITLGVTILAGLLVVAMVTGWRRRKNASTQSRSVTDPLTPVQGYGSLQDANTDDKTV